MNAKRCLLWELGVGSWMLGVEPAAGVFRLALALPFTKPTHHFDAIALGRAPERSAPAIQFSQLFHDHLCQHCMPRRVKVRVVHEQRDKIHA